MNKLRTYLKEQGIEVNDLQIYITAFTHSTFSNEKKLKMNYQKLEFLGDSILGKLTTEKIFNSFKDMDEGEMTILKANIINGDSLANFSLKEGFDKLIRFGKTKEELNKNKKILEDVFESYIAALYIDQGEKSVDKFLKRNVYKEIKKLGGKNLKNPKTILQEYLQSEKRGVIKYESVFVNNGYETNVIFSKKIFGNGFGSTKKESEVNAAKNALDKVGIK